MVLNKHQETQEMVFDAHIRAFAFFGGVPCKGIYDNMKTAVSKVLLGSEREFNPAFERLCAFAGEINVTQGSEVAEAAAIGSGDGSPWGMYANG